MGFCNFFRIKKVNGAAAEGKGNKDASYHMGGDIVVVMFISRATCNIM